MRSPQPSQRHKLDRRLLLSLALPPLAAGINTIVGYTVAHWITIIAHKRTGYLVSAGCFVVCAIAAGLAWDARRKLTSPDDTLPEDGRRLFMANLALLLTVLCVRWSFLRALWSSSSCGLTTDAHPTAPISAALLIASQGRVIFVTCPGAGKPSIVLPLAILLAVYTAGLFRRGNIETLRWRHASFYAGWLTLALALVSPIHELGEQLFSAHMLQHEILILVSAPLISASHPGPPCSGPSLRDIASISAAGCMRSNAAPPLPS